MQPTEHGSRQQQDFDQPKLANSRPWPTTGRLSHIKTGRGLPTASPRATQTAKPTISFQRAATANNSQQQPATASHSQPLYLNTVAAATVQPATAARAATARPHHGLGNTHPDTSKTCLNQRYSYGRTSISQAPGGRTSFPYYTREAPPHPKLLGVFCTLGTHFCRIDRTCVFGQIDREIP